MEFLTSYHQASANKQEAVSRILELQDNYTPEKVRDILTDCNIDEDLTEAIYLYLKLPHKMQKFVMSAVKSGLSADDIQTILDCKRNGMSEDETVDFILGKNR